MSVSTNELRQQRAKLVAEAQAVLDRAAREGREPITAEHNRFDTIMADVDALEVRIAHEERFEAGRRRPDGVGNRGEFFEAKGNSPEYRSAWASYLARGGEGLTAAESRAL